MAGEDNQLLTRILECLLEAAAQHTPADPELAARLLGLVLAHRGPFYISPFYDADIMLASLGAVLGDGAVAAALAVTADQLLSENPDWDAVLGAITGRQVPPPAGSACS